MRHLQVFVGWDPREDLAWQVCRHSILSRTDPDAVSVVALKQSDLRRKGIYTRPIDTRASTEFSLTRFLTPSLAGDRGFAIFVDCDFLFQTDICRVLDEVDRQKAVSVVKHKYTPKPCIKMDGKIQYNYPRKNWSSFIVFNLSHPAVHALTAEEVNHREPSYLHRFSWLKDDDIGELQKTWNFLVGTYSTPPNTKPNGLHFTEGGPWFEHLRNCEFSDLWLTELAAYKQHSAVASDLAYTQDVIAL